MKDNDRLNKMLKVGLTSKKASSDYLGTVVDLYSNYDMQHTLSYVLPQITSGVDILNNPDNYPINVVKKVKEQQAIHSGGVVLDYLLDNMFG